MNNNNPPLTFKRFQTIVNRLDLPRRPLPTVTAQQMERCKTRISKDHDRHYSVPSLEELGKKATINAIINKAFSDPINVLPCTASWSSLVV